MGVNMKILLLVIKVKHLKFVGNIL